MLTLTEQKHLRGRESVTSTYGSHLTPSHPFSYFPSLLFSFLSALSCLLCSSQLLLTTPWLRFRTASQHWALRKITLAVQSLYALYGGLFGAWTTKRRSLCSSLYFHLKLQLRLWKRARQLTIRPRYCGKKPGMDRIFRRSPSCPVCSHKTEASLTPEKKKKHQEDMRWLLKLV